MLTKFSFEEIWNVDRKVVKIKIELEALKKDTSAQAKQ